MAAKVPAGECFKIQPATMGNILAIKKKSEPLSKAAAQSFEAAEHTDRKYCKS